ncbi:MAG: ATP-binding protein [Thermodesulfobacteriota bacterium]|nr:ATP-binding protein [Thermodesulfobacteriota bacterium]
MLKRLSLRARILVLLGVLIGVNCAGALVTLWYTKRTQVLYTSMVDRDVEALLAAQKLESSLVMQKGFVTYYFLNRDPQWLTQLSDYHGRFEDWLQRARQSAYLEEAREILNAIESEYIRYAQARDRVVHLYKEGKVEEGAELHWKVRDQFHAIYDLTEAYKRLHEARILETRERYSAQAELVTGLAWSAIPATIVVGFVLGSILFGQVLEPIRRMALDSLPEGDLTRVGDEVKALSRRVRSLMDDVDEAHSQLEESREHLMQSEKLALVGKLAAGVAHSIRNPLTSVKMRLFSLERSLKLDTTQREDLEVISEEIRHIDTILRNFLEFSRPPKLKMQRISPSDVVDMTLQLLRHRLESYGVEVKVQRERRLPKISADPEQLKEVLVNLLLNACEAMTEGGVIQIREEEGVVPPRGRTLVIRVTDSGPGIPETLQDKVFEPFFSTKEEGSGLGLSIAKRIIEDHGGWMQVSSTGRQGTTFVIALPCEEQDHWLRS